MSRKSYDPSINPEEYAVPVEQGGTGALSLVAGAKALKLVTNDQKGQPNGPIALGSNGQIDQASIPAVAGTNKINLQGTFNIVTSETVTWKITDYDSFKTYTPTATAGTISISGDTITYTAPASPIAVTVTVAGRQIQFNVLTSQPAQPSITSPINGGNNVSLTAQATASAFVFKGAVDTHASSDWQLSTDPNFTNIVASTSADTTNKTTWSPAGMVVSTLYYLRVRYRGASSNVSLWSTVTVFTSSATNFTGTEEAKLTASDKAASNNFGYAVHLTLDGSRAVIGAKGFNSSAGKAYIFLRTGTSWVQEQILQPSDPSASSWFGGEVRISDDGVRAFIAAPVQTNGPYNNAGAVYIFTRNTSTNVWTQETKIIAPDLSGQSYYFGQAFSINAAGDLLVAGSTGAGSSNGTAYTFTRSGVNWTAETKVVGSESASKAYANSISCTPDGSRIAVGCGLANVGATSNAGAVLVYTRANGVLTLEQRIVSPNPGGSSYFGISTSFSAAGDRLLIGEYMNTDGSAYLFTRTGNVWAQEAKLLAPGVTASDQSGWRVWLTRDGFFAAIGCPAASVSGVSSGCVNIFSRSATTWTFSRKLSASDKISGMGYGQSLAYSGDSNRIAVGAYSDTPSSVSSAGSTYIDR